MGLPPSNSLLCPLGHRATQHGAEKTSRCPPVAVESLPPPSSQPSCPPRALSQVSGPLWRAQVARSSPALPALFTSTNSCA